jgi:hypothetical protein
VGLQLLDHLIVGRNELYSFADEGLLMSLAKQYAGLDLEGVD